MKLISCIIIQPVSQHEESLLQLPRKPCFDYSDYSCSNDKQWHPVITLFFSPHTGYAQPRQP